MNSLSSSLRVCTVDSSQQARALWLIFSGHEEGDASAQTVATLAAARDGRLSLEGLFTAERGGRLVGAVWVYSQPGGVAVVWPSRLVAGENDQTRRSLWSRVDDYLASRQVQLAQCVLYASDNEDARQMREVGYQYGAALDYFVALPDVFPVSAPQQRKSQPSHSPPLQFERYDAAQQNRLANIVEKTYEATLDCPMLNDLRTTHDVLAGYQSVGESGSALWQFVTHNGQDVGVLLNAMHPGEKQLELIYMGLAPSVRGRAWGRILIQETLWQAKNHHADRVIVAVDAQNTPALDSYRRAGLHRWAQRHVFLKPIPVAENAE